MTDELTFKDGKIQIPCPSCNKANAVSIEKIKDNPVCGECKADLGFPNHPVEASDQSFDDLIGKSPVPVLVDFWSPSCGPCRMMGPVLDSFAENKKGEVLVAKINTASHQKVAMKFGIQAIPTLIVFKNGQEATRQVGAVPEQMLDSMLSS
jgi:thioredoxin 2